ncbi:MAG: hypothetical protein LBD90_09605, partial [Bifidobacteriaceae bacterium]|nr:hypothetical protein [Bifidobacteriaceae bacterium]
MIALVGGVVADIARPDQARAVTFLNGWDGVYTRDQLWYMSYSSQTASSRNIRGWLDAKNVQPWTGSDQPPQLFTTTGTANGAAMNTDHDTFGLGPVFKGGPDGADDSLHLVADWWVDGDNVTVFKSELVNGTRQINPVAFGSLEDSTPVSGAVLEDTCHFDNTVGLEVNQKNGYLYAYGNTSLAYSFPFSGSGDVSNFRAGIFRLNDADKSITCMTAVNTLAPAGDSLNQQWKTLTGESVSGSWSAATDMAIDAEGNMYVLVRNGSKRHALVRVNVPHDSNGQPTAGAAWNYTVVQTWTVDASSDDVVGMAFVDGYLWTVNNSEDVYKWDTLARTVTRMGEVPQLVDARDFAAAQVAPVVTGTVYNDADGDGVIEDGEGGVGNATVEIYQNTGSGDAPAWSYRGSVLTDETGKYSALLNSADSEFLVRLKQPAVGGANAAQTYASAGQFAYGADRQANTVQPYCASQDGDYRLGSESGPCSGARRDGVDPAAVADPLAAGGGAAIVTKVTMRNDLAIAVADFGVSAAASWGDSPVPPTTNAQSGPYANPFQAGQPALRLGATAATYADGVLDPAADAHASDDGLEVAPVVGGRVGAWEPAQGQLMVPGQTYRFRAQAQGDSAAVAQARVKAWITTSSTAFTAAATTLLGGGGCSAEVDDAGYVYCDHVATGTVPAAGVLPLSARARVSNDAASTAIARGPSDPATSRWQPLGEVEDYHLGLAGGVLRLQARTAGGVAANVNLSLSNVSATSPSATTNSILTNAASTFQASGQRHALVNRARGVTITTTGVGAAGATGLGGWGLAAAALGGGGTRCHDSATGADLDVQIDRAAGVLTLAAPTVGTLPQDVTCQLTYVPAGEATKSWLSADPSDNAATPLAVGGWSSVEVGVFGQVQGQDGKVTEAAAAGERATLTLTPAAGSGA